MPATVPVPSKSPGDVLTSSTWNTYVSSNLNKLLNQGHRVLTVAQFTALTGIEDGDEVYLEVDSTNGIMWHLRYVAAEPTYKWRFLGGPEMLSEVATSEATASTTFVALTTAGPVIALPRAGDYDVRTSAGAAEGTAGNAAEMSYDIGAMAAAAADAISGTTTVSMSIARTQRKTGVATSSLTAKYRANAAGTATFKSRCMAVRPARIRHDA